MLENYRIKEELEELIMIKFEIEDNGLFMCRAIKRALEIKKEMYKEWCLEFFLTFHFEPIKKNEMMKKKCIWFRLYGKEHNFILLEFALTLGLYKEKELEHPLFERYFTGLNVNKEGFNHRSQDTYFIGDLWVMHFLDVENVRINVPWVLAQYLSKKAVGLREASDINGGHYVSRIARNLGYFTPNKTKKCLAPAEGTLLDKKTLKGILDNSKMRIKENDVEEAGSKPKDEESKKGYKAKEKSVGAEEVKKANEWRGVMLLKTRYQLDYALPILIHLGNTSGYTFASDYNPRMVPPYPCSTTPFIEVGTSSMAGTSKGNQEKKVVSRFSGENIRASYRLEDESTDSDNSEQSDNDDDSNTCNDMDEE
ncbi:hypothetical protein Tco_1485781 [Tanacetum coccineum]